MMSGQLVGEVIAASTQLRAGGLSRNGFLALIAIAEKASNGDRQASVRWDHLCDGLYGVSVKTARRAVKELEQVGLIRVVSKGWANQHNERPHAPVYEVSLWTPMSRSTNRIGTPVSISNGVDVDKSKVDVDKLEVDVDTRVPLTSADISLDGSFDGSIDGDARTSERTGQQDNGSPGPTHPKGNSHGKAQTPDGAGMDKKALPDWAIPPPPCREHPNGPNHGKPCGPCGAIRRWNTEEARAKRQDTNYRQAHTGWKQLHVQARAGMYGDWRPVKPPLNRTDFDPNVPWRQPIPPPEADLCVNGYDRW